VDAPVLTNLDSRPALSFARSSTVDTIPLPAQSELTLRKPLASTRPSHSGAMVPEFRTPDAAASERHIIQLSFMASGRKIRS